MLETARDGTTMVLTLNNPAKRNALSAPLREGLLEAFLRLERDRDLRAAVIIGAGGNFCSGGDIDSMNQSTDLAAGRERFRGVHELTRLMIRGSKPVIAAVEGWAVGAGLGLALAADTVIATPGARFRAGFPQIGLIADFGLLHTLPARIGPARARQFLLYDEVVDAKRAGRIGLTDETVASGELLERALALAGRFSQLAPLATAQTRAALARGLDQVLDWERDTQAALLQTADHAEGRTAFLERRKPNFTGR